MLTGIIIIVFLAMIFGMIYLKKINISFNVRVVLGLILGVIFGLILQFAISDKGSVGSAMSWISVIGSAYVRLLQMIVMPLIFVSITKAIATQESGMGKSAVRILAVLLVTVFISAIISSLISVGFGLTAEGLNQGDAEISRGASLIQRQESFESTTIQEKILEVIPRNPFYAFTGQGANATLSVVFFALFVGYAINVLRRKKSANGDSLVHALDVLSELVLRMVQVVLRITPYGVMAMMANIAATSNFAQMSKLIVFIGASYAAILAMFIVHGVLLAAVGLNPIKFFKKSLPNLLFAFTSRSSSATLPITVTNLEKNMGVPEGIANLAGSLGTCIGQNGCAGVYPAMLAVMIAPTLGINPLSVEFLLKLALVITVSSFGIAGVGGGATFAAIIVLSTMGFPIELAGLLVSIEPLIDMGRTALNVSDSLVAGTVAAKLGKTVDLEVYNSNEVIQ